MRSLASLLLLLLLMAAPGPAASLFYHVAGADAGSWPQVFESIGLRAAPSVEEASVIALRQDAEISPEQAEAWIASGKKLVIEGASPLAEHFGFIATETKLAVQSIRDARIPEIRIIWEEPLTLPEVTTPAGATVFAAERWRNAPLLAGYRKGPGAVLWIASSPGEEGYERYPYILHALMDLGLTPPFRSKRLAVFFDYSYRIRVDLEYFAALWRKIGVGSLHVTAWHFFEPDPVRDEYLKELIEECHRQGITVYAWLELPHVSEKFWEDHPQWREKTALLQDAHLDWRKLMNLQNREAFQAIRSGVEALVNRFDWDGVNVAELYFESLQSYLNPARFTPLNDDVREEFRDKHGFDPLVIWDENSPLHYEKSIEGIRPFLDFRADLAKRMQEEWLAEMERIRQTKPDLDLVLTHVDDRFDTQMRDAIGADAARLLPLLNRYDFTFLIEDPATIWHLGPKRYPEMARRYAPITPKEEKLAIDINIVERYQDVYPTKKQTGTELFQLVHLAAGAFPQVALYFENSILEVDRELLSASAAVIIRAEEAGGVLILTAPYGGGVNWDGPALVNGKPWPYYTGDTLWLPVGDSHIEKAADRPEARLLDFSGKLLNLDLVADGLVFSYSSDSRALAILDREPQEVFVDDAPSRRRVEQGGSRWVVHLPRGKHTARIRLTHPEASKVEHSEAEQ